jgi:hypothetical protein
VKAYARRRLLCAALAAVTVVAGLVWRLAPLGLPPFAYKYGGSALWAAMVYWLFAAVLPRGTPGRVAVYACVLAALVELSRLYHTAALDAFRITLAGRLLLGRFFSVWNIVVYWLAMGCAAAADRFWLRRPAQRR